MSAPKQANPKRKLIWAALLAWVWWGADSLSSACYGPEETYIALGSHPQFAIFISFIMVFTIFVISLGYNQVIELFPSGGGGYKAASKLLHPYAGLIAGAALLVDYMLTIAVSIVCGVDALYSLVPLSLHHSKLYVEFGVIIVLMMINLGGVKESMYVLGPIFVGFIVTHIGLIIYGITAHSAGLAHIVPLAVNETQQLSQAIGYFAVIGLTLHAYSLGSGTYTGLEAVANNVQKLKEPRAKTGKRTMLLMATALSVTAGGIMLLYLLWQVQVQPGKTLNAVVFSSILGGSDWAQTILILTLQLEAALLLVAANTGFAAGPNALANMAVDGWVPNRFRYLSNHFVIQNGVLFFGIAAIAFLFLSDGRLTYLVVLYSINVFITFSLSLLGISTYWVKQRRLPRWKRHFTISALAFVLTTTILFITIYYKFEGGGWLSLAVTFVIVLLCAIIKHHYDYLEQRLGQLDSQYKATELMPNIKLKVLDPQQKTAVILVNSISVGMHTMASVIRLFPNQFQNYIFISIGVVDVQSYGGDAELLSMQEKVDERLQYFIRFCSEQGLAADGYAAFGTDVVAELRKLIDTILRKYPNTLFFSTQIIFPHDNMITRFLHNQTPLILQQYLHGRGKQVVILPMQI